MSEELLTTSDVARLLRISEASVRNMERDGRLPALKTAGGQRIFKTGDVQRAAEKRAQSPERRGR